MYIKALCFLATIVLPFLFLPPLWAIITILFITFVSTLFSFPIVVIFKNSKQLGYFLGIGEALILFVITQVIQTPDNFFLVTTILYSINQCVRALEHRSDEDGYETKQLVGYVITIILGALVKWR